MERPIRKGRRDGGHRTTSLSMALLGRGVRDSSVHLRPGYYDSTPRHCDEPSRSWRHMPFGKLSSAPPLAPLWPTAPYALNSEARHQEARWQDHEASSQCLAHRTRSQPHHRSGLGRRYLPRLEAVQIQSVTNMHPHTCSLLLGHASRQSTHGK